MPKNWAILSVRKSKLPRVWDRNSACSAGDNPLTSPASLSLTTALSAVVRYSRMSMGYLSPVRGMGRQAGMTGLWIISSPLQFQACHRRTEETCKHMTPVLLKNSILAAQRVWCWSWRFWPPSLKSHQNHRAVVGSSESATATAADTRSCPIPASPFVSDPRSGLLALSKTPPAPAEKPAFP